MNKFTIDTEFKGIAGARAYHSANTLLRSFYYLPSNSRLDFKEMCDWFDESSDEIKLQVLTDAVHHGAMLEDYEVQSLLIFAKDKNNISMTKEVIGSLDPFTIHEALIEVSLEIFKKKVFFYQTSK
jgi:hypothetical protein